MRPVLAGDIAAVARVLYLLPTSERAERLGLLLEMAERAERHLVRTGSAHPCYGTGSLMAATSRMPRAAEPDFCDVEYCRCWILTLEAVAQRALGCVGNGKDQASELQT